MNAAVSPQSVNPAMLLLELGHRARAARSNAELRFLLVNDSRLLVPYRQACLWLDDGGVTALSGVVETDRNTPYAQWLHGVCQFLQAQQPIQVRRIEPAQLPPELASSWSEWLGPYAVWVPLVQDGQKPVPEGGLLLSGAQAIEEQRFALLAEWGHIWFHAYSALQTGQPRFLAKNLRHRESTPKAGGKKKPPGFWADFCAWRRACAHERACSW